MERDLAARKSAVERKREDYFWWNTLEDKPGNTLKSNSATSDRVNALAERRASMLNCSVCWLISRDAKAAIVTSVMAAASCFVSSLIRICGGVLAN
jgi:hypothetical protein